MMKAVFRVICVCLSACLLSACGSSSPSNRQQIESLFSGMYTAFAKGDYATVCTDLSQRQQENIVAGAQRAGLHISSCTDAFTALLKQAHISKAQIAHAFGDSGITRTLDSISVHGDQATVTFTEGEKGQSSVETDALVRQGGQWRADRIVRRSQAG
jgi:hypothetical protein